ncbi:MAG: U32 family peptidase [Clostridia bacterium]|nr:U32 family peptidase [Clostridia bacterium]
MNTPELLAPAGGLRQLKAAVRFGADAVYLGLERFGMRAHAGNFDRDALLQAVSYAHEHGVKVYLTLNIFPYDEDIPLLTDDAAFAHDAGVDALIMSDPGAIMSVRDSIPDMPIHLSTQADTLNAASVRFWHANGIKRIVLARELSLDRIRRIHESIPPDCEIETFVHGAVCMAYSGRCALSKHLTGRDANRGDCAQACRWRYVLEEEKRPGQYFPVEENTRGTAIFSAGDMNLISRLDELCSAGICSFKIEGRMKNEFYVATVVGAYRRALNAIRNNRYTREVRQALSDELDTISHRPYDTGFYFGEPERPGGNEGLTQTKEFAGIVLDSRDGRISVKLKCAVSEGETLELLTPSGVYAFSVDDLRLESGEPIARCAVPDAIVTMTLPFPCEGGDLLRCENKNHR